MNAQPKTDVIRAVVQDPARKKRLKGKWHLIYQINPILFRNGEKTLISNRTVCNLYIDYYQGHISGQAEISTVKKIEPGEHCEKCFKAFDIKESDETE